MDKDDEADEIRRSMQQIRGGLKQDVEGIRVQARRLADWHYYLTRFPLASIATAAAIGFLVIPKRPRVVQADAETLAQMAKDHRLVVQTVGGEPERKGIMGLLSSAIAAGLLRYGKSYATAQLQQLVRGVAAGKARRQVPVGHGNGRGPVDGGP